MSDAYRKDVSEATAGCFADASAARACTGAALRDDATSPASDLQRLLIEEPFVRALARSRTAASGRRYRGSFEVRETLEDPTRIDVPLAR